MGFRDLVRGWPERRPHVRSESRRRGLDFLVDWLPAPHPGLGERTRHRGTDADFSLRALGERLLLIA